MTLRQDLYTSFLVIKHFGYLLVVPWPYVKIFTFPFGHQALWLPNGYSMTLLYVKILILPFGHQALCYLLAAPWSYVKIFIFPFGHQALCYLLAAPWSYVKIFIFPFWLSRAMVTKWPLHDLTSGSLYFRRYGYLLVAPWPYREDL